MIYGMKKYQNPKTTKHPQIEGDTSNPNQAIKHLQIGEDTSNPKKITKHSQTGGDTSNPNSVTRHPQTGGDTSNPKIPILMTQQKLSTSQRERHFRPPHLETENPVEALNKSTQQTPAEEDEVLKQLKKTQANISLWVSLMASYKHCQNLVDLLNQIQVPTITTPQDLNVMIRSINRELTISYSNKDLTKKRKYHNNSLHITRCQGEEDTYGFNR